MAALGRRARRHLSSARLSDTPKDAHTLDDPCSWITQTRKIATGFECGIKLKDYNDIKEADQLEFFKVREIAQTL